MALLVLVACNGGGSTRGTAPVALSTQSPVSSGAGSSTSESPTNDATRPVGYLYFALLNGSTFTSLHDAEEASIAACMAGRGWKYEPIPYNAIELSPDVSGSFLALKTFRTQFGYAVNFRPSDSIVDPNQAYVASLSTSQSSAYYAALVGGTEGDGMGRDSCTFRAESDVRAGIPYYDPQYSVLVDDYIAELESDARYVHAIAEWRSCMASLGFVVDDPDQMVQYVSDNFGNGAATDASNELRAATMDVECYESHVLAVKLQVDTEILDGFVEAGRLPSSAWSGSG